MSQYVEDFVSWNFVDDSVFAKPYDIPTCTIFLVSSSTIYKVFAKPYDIPTCTPFYSFSLSNMHYKIK